MRPILALALLGVGPAHAFQLWGTGPMAGASVQITTDVEMRYHQTMLDDPGRRTGDGPFELFPSMAVHDYFEQVGRTNLQVTKDALSIGLQFCRYRLIFCSKCKYSRELIFLRSR